MSTPQPGPQMSFDGSEGSPPRYRCTNNAWENLTTPRINPLNLKCETLPIFTLQNQYSRNFHLSWLAFWVAFLAWFAFAPLIPEAVKEDLKLTPEQIGNSNICALCATLIVRVIVGPLVDRFGPRKVMAALLVIGAIPSGMAGLVTSARGLYAVRFFIGILGATFVPCQAWTTAFFDKKIVGTANALAAGWGNAGGGCTFIIMVALYERLVRDGLSRHAAWRASFAVVPVPILFLTALLVMLFGTDHPAGRWSERHNLPAVQIQIPHPPGQLDGGTPNPEAPVDMAGDSKRPQSKSSPDKEAPGVVEVAKLPSITGEKDQPVSALDVAVNRTLTLRAAIQLFANPLTWLPAVAYAVTFGFELAIDAYLANILYVRYKSRTFGQKKAGYIASIFGLLNVFSRPLGGYVSDLLYRRFGVRGKKYFTLLCPFVQGILCIALGFFLDGGSESSLAAVIALLIFIALWNEAGNGANFALVPHCNPDYNGFMSGIVGAAGNVGGIIFAVIFRFEAMPVGRAFWISGIISACVPVLLALIPVPSWSMLNNCLYRVAILTSATQEGVKLTFEHPTVAGNAPGGWMERLKSTGMDLTRPRFSGAVYSRLETRPGAQTSNETSMRNPNVTRRITKEELAAQDKKRPWFVVGGEVYDGTGFLKDHPGGGDSILLVAGEDATEDFVAIHSANGRAKLAQFHIGTLVGGVLPREAVGIEDATFDASFLNPRSWKPVTLRAVTPVNHDSRLFRFALGSKDQLLGLPVGQHVFMRIRRKDTGELVQRAYTPVSRQNVTGFIEFLIKLYMPKEKHFSGGKMSVCLNQLAPGDEVELKGPLGSFIWQGRGTTLYHGVATRYEEVGMICAGSGITPIVQVLRAILYDEEDKTTRVWLVCANRTEGDILLREELDALHALHGQHRFALFHTLSDAVPLGWAYGRGRVSDAMLRDNLPAPSERGLVLACGPNAMMNDTVRPGLRSRGWDIERQLVVF